MWRHLHWSPFNLKAIPAYPLLPGDRRRPPLPSCPAAAALGTPRTTHWWHQWHTDRIQDKPPRVVLTSKPELASCAGNALSQRL